MPKLHAGLIILLLSLISSLSSAPVAGAMTEAQEHNLQLIESEENPPRQYSAPHPVSSYQQENNMVPRPTYRPPIYQDYRRSYGNSAYIPMGPPPASMIYQGGTPNAPVSPLFKMFSGLLHPPAEGAPAGAENVAPSAVSGTYGGPQNMSANAGPNASVEQGGSNPFNLSPFGMLHYMWDDTTYTSPTNPVALYSVQNDLQIAKQQSQLAQSAAARAKYLTDPQARRQAAQQAQYYAQQSQLAAQRAHSESLSGSLDPAQLATSASDDASQAYAAANQARSYASGGY